MIRVCPYCGKTIDCDESDSYGVICDNCGTMVIE